MSEGCISSMRMGLSDEVQGVKLFTPKTDLFLNNLSYEVVRSNSTSKIFSNPSELICIPEPADTLLAS